MKNQRDESFYHEIVITDTNLPLRFFYSNDGPSYIPPHFHDDMELICLLSGKLHVTMCQRKYTLLPGDAILFHTNAIHSTLSETADTTAYVLQLPRKFLKQCLPDPDSYYFELPCPSEACHTKCASQDLNRIRELLMSCDQLYREMPEFYEIKILSLLYDLVYTLYRAFSMPQIKKKHTREYKYYERLTAITSYINEHYTETLPLTTLAELISVTPAYLSRFFKNALQMTLTDYITSVRLEHAYTDLLTTDYPVSIISEKNGFSNYAMFVQKFKQAYHNTPLKVRKSRKSSL